MANPAINPVNDCEHDAGPPPVDLLPINPPYNTVWAAWCLKCHSWQQVDNVPKARPSQGDATK